MEASNAANEPESLADYFERTKGEKQRSLKKLGHGQSAAREPLPEACSCESCQDAAWPQAKGHDAARLHKLARGRSPSNPSASMDKRAESRLGYSGGSL